MGNCFLRFSVYAASSVERKHKRDGSTIDKRGFHVHTSCHYALLTVRENVIRQMHLVLGKAYLRQTIDSRDAPILHQLILYGLC